MYLHSVFSKPGIARLVLFLSLVLLSACDNSNPSLVPKFNPAEWKTGGETTVNVYSKVKFDLPVANLPSDLKTDFHAGKALAQQPWVKAPTVTDSRDGLGPVYNARTCMACHVNGGKGHTPKDNQTELFSSLIRVSTLGNNSSETYKTNGVMPHPAYGDQIQTQSTSLAHQLRHTPSVQNIVKDVLPEAYVFINWQHSVFNYPDGKQISLKYPVPKFKNLGYGEIENDTLISLRTAPMIQGMGLIQLIPQSQIDALTDVNDSNQDGISGRSNQVWDSIKQQTVSGRFGLKANKATLALTVAGAFANDLGISNPLVSSQPCTALQVRCQQAINGNDENGFELTQAQLNSVIYFNQHLAPVIARNLDNKQVLKGRELFYETGCQGCHNPSFKTGSDDELPQLSNQLIWPYSDFLLHDMGEALSDNRPDFEASGQEWRTPPLWGIGLRKDVNGSTALMHDGRADTIEEAILWHGGEAKTAKHIFMNHAQADRESLIKFVESI